MFSVRMLSGQPFGVDGCVVVGGTGNKIGWVAEASTGRRVAVRSPGSVSAAVAVHRNGAAPLLRPAGPPPDILRWAAAIAADAAAGISHGIPAADW